MPGRGLVSLGGLSRVAARRAWVAVLSLTLLSTVLALPVAGAVDPTERAAAKAGAAAGAAEDFTVTASAAGGWDFSWQPVPGAATYTVTRDVRDFVGSQGTAAETLVAVPATKTSAHLPDGPWHTRTGWEENFLLTARDASGAELRSVPDTTSCPRAFFLSARGSGENPPEEGYKAGLGTQGDHVYRRMMEWLGMTSSTLRVLPVLGDYPAVKANWQEIASMHSSANKGTDEALALLKAVQTHCKGRPVVMFGYSQGGWVVGDAATKAVKAMGSFKDLVSLQLFADARYASKLPNVHYYAGAHGGRGVAGARGPIGTGPGVATEWCFEPDFVCNVLGNDFHGEIYDTCYRDQAAAEASRDLGARLGITRRPPSLPSCDLKAMVGSLVEDGGRSWLLERSAGEQYLRAVPLVGPASKRCYQARGSKTLDGAQVAAIRSEISWYDGEGGLACINPDEVRSRAVIPVVDVAPLGYWVHSDLKRYRITDGLSSACYAERSGPRGPVPDMVFLEVVRLSSGGQAPVCLAAKGNAGKVLRLRSDQPSSGITYLVDGAGHRRHIPNAQVLSCLLSWQNRGTVDDLTWAHVNSLTEVSTKATCAPPATIANKIIKNPSGNSFLVDSNLVKHSIDTTWTYHCLVDRGYPVIDVSQGQVDSVKSGSPATNCISPTRVEGQIIRRSDGVSWAVVGGQRRHIPSQTVDVCARAVHRLSVGLSGLDYNAAASIPESTSKYECTIEGTVVQALDRPQPYPAYRISAGKRYWIPDVWTFDYWKRRLPVVGSYNEGIVKELPDGGTDASRLDPAAIPANSIIRRSDGVSWVVDADKARHHIAYSRDDTCWRLLKGYQVSATGLTGSQASALPEKEAWPCVVGPRVVKSDDGSSYFVDASNTRHRIPDVETFWALSRKYAVVGPWPAGEVANFLPGSDHPRMLDPEAVKNSIVCRSDGVCWAVDENAVRHHIPSYGDNVCWRWVNGWGVSRNGVSGEQANSLGEGSAWGCSMNGRIIATNEGHAYYMEGNTRRWIPDGYDFDCLQRGRHVIRGMGLAEASGLPETSAMPAQECSGIDIVTIFARGNSRYVTTEIGYGGADHAMIRAARTSVGSDWERFRLIGNCASRCLIQSLVNRKLILGQFDYQGYAWGEMRGVSSNAAGSWEGFRLVGDCNSGCGILALGNGRYASAELDYRGNGYGMLRARATTIGGWERFIIR